MVSDSVRRRVAAAVRRRGKTDLRIYPSIVCLVVLAFTVTAVLYITGLAGTEENRGLQILGVIIVGTCVLLSMMYLTVSRNYRHNRRDIELMEALCDLASEMSSEGSFRDGGRIEEMRRAVPTNVGRGIWMAVFVLAVIPAMAAPCFALLMDDPHRGAVYGIAACIISLALCFLVIILNMGFPKRHEKSFFRFADTFSDGLAAAGWEAERYRQVIGVRNFVLMILLTLVTFTLFFGIWLYLSARDLNRHMDQQWNYEDYIMDLVEGL